MTATYSSAILDNCGFDITFSSNYPVDTYNMFGRGMKSASWTLRFRGRMSERGRYGYRGLQSYIVQVLEILSIQLLKEEAYIIPDEQILVRSAEEPPIAKSEVLLRAAQTTPETPKEELLRVSQEQGS